MLGKKNYKFIWNSNWVFFGVVLIFILLNLLTNFGGTTDTKEYTDTSKYLAGEYSAKIRASHSYLFGAIHSPLIKLTNSFLIFKISSIIFLMLLVYSVYWVSGKNKKALWLMILSPVIWYVAPWTSPLQISCLLFFWGYYFIKKYDHDEKIKNLIYSGILLGFSLSIWGSIMYFVVLLGIIFLFDRKFIEFVWFGIFLVVGLIPQFLIDYILFDFILFGLLRNLLGNIAFSLFGGIYGQGTDFGIVNLLLLLPFLPFYIFLIFKKEIFSKEKKTIIFLLFSSILVFLNPQIRILLIFIPIITLLLVDQLNQSKYWRQLILFALVSLIVIIPHAIQISYETKGVEFSSFILNINDLQIMENDMNELRIADLKEISEKYPLEMFVVGPTSDSYRELANIYWGDEIEEFVSNEDYQIYLSGKNVAEKELCSNTKIDSRRDFCLSVVMKKAFNDKTEYGLIKYGISLTDDLGMEGFEKIEDYQVLSLWKKI